jgi:quinoprotein glucose dehydrogenase
MDGKKVTRREKLLEGIGRVRDVKEGPDGTIYVSVEQKGIVKLVEKETPKTQE